MTQRESSLASFCLFFFFAPFSSCQVCTKIQVITQGQGLYNLCPNEMQKLTKDELHTRNSTETEKEHTFFVSGNDLAPDKELNGDRILKIEIQNIYSIQTKGQKQDSNRTEQEIW